MKTDNNVSISFGQIRFSNSAMASLSNRLPSGKFVSEVPAMVEKHSINPIDIYVNTAKNSDRLFCQVTWHNPNKDGVGFFNIHKKEGYLNKMFSNPLSFLNRICKQSNKLAEDFSRIA